MCDGIPEAGIPQHSHTSEGKDSNDLVKKLRLQPP